MTKRTEYYDLPGCQPLSTFNFYVSIFKSKHCHRHLRLAYSLLCVVKRTRRLGLSRELTRVTRVMLQRLPGTRRIMFQMRTLLPSSKFKPHSPFRIPQHQAGTACCSDGQLGGAASRSTVLLIRSTRRTGVVGRGGRVRSRPCSLCRSRPP